MRQGTGHDESFGHDEGFGQDESLGSDGHRTSAVERGAFTHARCSCGWVGPARRARELSRTDATRHSAQQEGSSPGGSQAPDGPGYGVRGSAESG